MSFCHLVQKLCELHAVFWMGDPSLVRLRQMQTLWEPICIVFPKCEHIQQWTDGPLLNQCSHFYRVRVVTWYFDRAHRDTISDVIEFCFLQPVEPHWVVHKAYVV